MATMQGITGKLSGKMGAAVFRVREGQQVVTQYNPIVKNPNTQGQQDQRAKFKLMSQLAAVMAPGFGTMSVTSRKSKGKPSQRNAFTQLNFPLVEVSSDNQTVTAKIPMEQIQLTSSTRQLGTITVEPSNNTAEVSVATAAADITSVRMVLVSYPSFGGETQPAIKEIVDVPVTSGEAAHTFTGLGVDKYTLLAFGMIPSASASIKTNLDNLHTPADEDFIGALELNQMVSDGLIAETKTAGANIDMSA